MGASCVLPSVALLTGRSVDLLGVLWKCFLPPVMHPEIVSGIGIATNHPFGSESSLFNNEMKQFLFEQVIE